jgi:hypothetical protein
MKRVSSANTMREENNAMSLFGGSVTYSGIQWNHVQAMSRFITYGGSHTLLYASDVRHTCAWCLQENSGADHRTQVLQTQELECVCSSRFRVG